MRPIEKSEAGAVAAAQVAVFRTGRWWPNTHAETLTPVIADRAVISPRRHAIGSVYGLLSAEGLPYARAIAAAAWAVGDEELWYLAMGVTEESLVQFLGIALSANPNSRDLVDPIFAALKEGIKLRHYVGSEDMIVSPSGAWGVAFDEYHWATIGGSERFVAALKAYLPRSLEDELREHMNWCRYMYEVASGHRPQAWIARHVAYLAGRERAEQLLSEFGIPIPPDAW